MLWTCSVSTSSHTHGERWIAHRKSTVNDNGSQWWRSKCLQVLGAGVAALETQLQIKLARAQEAGQERSASIQSPTAIRQERAGGMVETKEINQPITLNGVADQDFGEWTHKVCTFMVARFGDQVLGALIWTSRQREIVVQGCGPSTEKPPQTLDRRLWRRCRWGGPIDVIDDSLENSTPTLCLFSIEAANRIVRIASEDSFDSWRRLHCENDPTSSMRRVAILQQVHLGFTLEN